MHTNTHKYTHIYIYTYIDMYVLIHIYTHICIHTRGIAAISVALRVQIPIEVCERMYA